MNRILKPGDRLRLPRKAIQIPIDFPFDYPSHLIMVEIALKDPQSPPGADPRAFSYVESNRTIFHFRPSALPRTANPGTPGAVTPPAAQAGAAATFHTIVATSEKASQTWRYTFSVPPAT